MRSSLAIRCSIMTLPVAVLFLIAGCGDKQMGSPKAETPKTDPVSETPDAVLTPTQLVDEFKKDNKAFLSKYQNKTLEITGKVTEFGYEFGGETYLLLEGPGIIKVHCKESQPWSKAMPGQTTTFRGKCDPDFGVREWQIVKVTGDPPPTFAAEQLAKEYKTDEEGTSKKLRGKFLIVTGQIVKVENEGGIVYLKNPEQKPAIMCRFASNSAIETARNKEFKAGRQVKVLGQSLSGEPELAACVTIDAP